MKLRPVGAPIWFTGNRRMVGFGAALLLLVGVLELGVVRSHELDPSDPVRIVAIIVLGLLVVAGLGFILLPDKLKVTPDRLQIYISGVIPGKNYRQAAFRGLQVDFPAGQVELEFASGRRIPFFKHPDPFVIYQLARDMSTALKFFVRHEDLKLFKDGNPPSKPNFFMQFQKLEPAVIQSRFPLAEASRNEEGHRLKLFMARALPNGERGLIVKLGPSGLKIFAEGMPQLVDVPLLDVIMVAAAPGYVGIMTRNQGVLKLEGVGSPQDRYLVQHVAGAMRELVKDDKSEPEEKA